MKLFRPILSAVCVGLFLTACGDDDPTVPVDENPVETRVIKDNPSFASDVQEIFTRRGCMAPACRTGTW